VLCQQFDDGFESDSDFSDTSNEHIEFYSENNVDRLSNASDSFSRPKTRERRLPILGNNISGIGLQESRTFFRKKTLMLRTEEVNDDLESSDDEQLVLDGDYILRTALLKDQDIQALSAKEMRYCLLKCCKVHIGQDEIGKKMVEIYKKPEVREITEEEVNTIVIQFLRDIRKQDNNKKILDLMDNIQHQVEKICPFGSMMRIVYRLDNQNNDVWWIPNRDESYWGLLRIQHVMDHFMKSTNGKTPILIKDVFQQSKFGIDKLCSVSVNGEKKIISDDIAEAWESIIREVSSVTSGNLHSIPKHLYKFHLFWIPLKHLNITHYKKHAFMKQSMEDDSISLSSLASFDEEKPMVSQNAMIMFFLWKKKNDKVNNIKDIKRQSIFSFNINSNHKTTSIRTKFLIQALHDISDIFGAHHEKIFAR